MFTGIIQTIVKMKNTTPLRDGVRVRLERPRGITLALGESVALDGICTTVTKTGGSHFEVHLMPETLRKTTGNKFKPGKLINFERSLTLSTLVGGHFLQGHVSGVGQVAQIQKREADWLLSVRVPTPLSKYFVREGAVAINGVSLTVAREHASTFTVALIPYTLSHTNLGELKVGDPVNIEVDIVARYLEKWMRK